METNTENKHIEHKHSETKRDFSKLYDRYHKVLVFIPIILLIACLAYLFMFYQQNGDIIKKDISLTGGTSIQINTNISSEDFERDLADKFDKFSTRQISDIFTNEQIAVIIDTNSKPEEAVPILEEYLGYKLTSDNSSVEFTGAVLGNEFYLQVLLSVLFSFIFMGVVVFYIFSKNKKIKLIIICLALIPPALFLFKVTTTTQTFFVSFVILALIVSLSVKYNIPATAVIFAAFTDIIMTLTLVNLLGMEISGAGIIAFLMLIGYSVDTDILLTTRVLKGAHNESVNARIFGAFKTGITMTLTSIAVVIIGLIITSSLSEVLSQIFIILFFGLIFDIFTTWTTNAGMIKWYVERKND